MTVKIAWSRGSVMTLRSRAGSSSVRYLASEYKPWSVEGSVELKFEFKDKAKSPDRVYNGGTVLTTFEAWLGQ
jgi:hypothetical protein